MIKERNSISESNIFTWVVDNFSTLNGTKLKSKTFIIGCVQWNLELHIRVHGEWISIYLGVVDAELTKAPYNWFITGEFKIRIRNQLHTRHLEHQTKFFHRHSVLVDGYENYMRMCDFNDKSKGFLKNDSLIAEVEFLKVDVSPSDCKSIAVHNISNEDRRRTILSVKATTPEAPIVCAN